MYFKHVYEDGLAQASYVVGCQATGSAIVIDPRRDIQVYLEIADSEGFSIDYITETHIHADFLSGTRELAAATGAKVLLSGEGGADWQYDFDHESLTDGDSFTVGNLRFDVIHTPGHTPEHICFVLTDLPSSEEPVMLFTGDFLFVGDVGRPDLLEEAAGVKGAREVGAHQMYESVHKLDYLPDFVQVWPGHGAGSACGKGLSSIPHSTLGYEKRFNWASAIESEEEFVAAVLDGQPEPPTYFAEMKRVNREGPRVLHGFPEPDIGTLARLRELLAEHAWVVDTRSAAEYGAGHIAGTINIPLNRSFNTWAGWLLPYDRPFHLIVDQAHVDEAVRDLAMVGLDDVGAVFAPTVIDAWAESGGEFGTIETRTPGEVEAALLADDAEVLDVRGTAEWRDGHLEGVDVIPTGYLLDHLDELPRRRDLVLHCQSGARSAIAASLLQRAGFENVAHMQGGFAAWEARGLPTVREDLGSAVPA